MAYTGRATYDDTDSIGEDVSDLVALNSPHETPLLDFLGDASYPATSTKHEWIEDALNPWTDTWAEDMDNSETAADVTTYTKFRVGDLILADDELMYVSAKPGTPTLTVVRGWGDSDAATHANGAVITIVGTAMLEGADAVEDRSTSRGRVYNYTQIFSRTVIVSGTTNSVSQIGGQKELERQKQNRLIECMVDLEKSMIIGCKGAAASATVPSTMQGIRRHITTNANNASSATLTEALFRSYIQSAWANGARKMDFAILGGFQKSTISSWKQTATRWESAAEAHKVKTEFYESDFGLIRLILNPWMPSDEIIVGTSSNISVIPMQGRSFFYNELGKTGDASKGQIIGEYTCEVRNEASHMLIYSLATS